MKFSIPRIYGIGLLTIISVFARHTPQRDSFVEHRPENLSVDKQRIVKYYDDGHFEREMKQVIDDALVSFKNCTCGPNSAVVFDIDDTLLWYYPNIKTIQFGYVPAIFHQWAIHDNQPQVPHIKRLYDFFVKRGCKIILLSGVGPDNSDFVIRNVKHAGFTKADVIITRTREELKMTAAAYKTAHRKRLTEQGYDIIASIGDQWSDLTGGYAQHTVKIPNYLYIIE